ncbi:hypothetical protein Ddc_00063 [Ditylenchus destructor]|nr:hypothetical protein Ddc_00063 [Ditylenchus destructor]
MSPQPYVTYVNFVEACLAIVFQCTAIFLMSHLVYCSRFRSPLFELRAELSTSLKIYLCMHIILSTLSLPYHIYLAVYWRTPWHVTNTGNAIFNPEMLYWLGIWSASYMAVAPAALFGLAIDRCLVLYLSIRYSRAIKRIVISLGVLLIVVVYGFSYYVYLLELPLSQEKSK